LDVKKAVNPVFTGVSGLSWTALERVLVPDVGIELTTFALQVLKK
jgi:hypothetical protein